MLRRSLLFAEISGVLLPRLLPGDQGATPDEGVEMPRLPRGKLRALPTSRLSTSTPVTMVPINNGGWREPPGRTSVCVQHLRPAGASTFPVVP